MMALMPFYETMWWVLVDQCGPPQESLTSHFEFELCHVMKPKQHRNSWGGGCGPVAPSVQHWLGQQCKAQCVCVWHWSMNYLCNNQPNHREPPGGALSPGPKGSKYLWQHQESRPHWSGRFTEVPINKWSGKWLLFLTVLETSSMSRDTIQLYAIYKKLTSNSMI